jgi:hypothetical protein
MERMILKLAGNFSIPSQDPNADLKTPLDSLDSLDVDRLSKHENRLFMTEKFDFENLPTFNSAEGRILTS